MKRTMSVWLALALAVACVAPLMADEAGKTLSMDYLLDVKPGHRAEFEAGMKKQMEWYKANGETWHWHTWEWLTGQDTGSFTFRSPGHAWADMDQRGERTQRARAQFFEHVEPHLESVIGSIEMDLPDLTHWPEELTEVPFVSVYTMRLKSGTEETFTNAIKKIRNAAAEADYKMYFAFVTVVNGGSGSNFFAVIPHKSWAEMKGPETPLWKMVEEKLGRTEAQEMRATLDECIEDGRSGLARFRADLSYMPGE